MNHTIRQETNVEAFGRRMHAGPVISTEDGRIIKQEIKETAFYTEDGHDYRIVVELSFDDDCRNGHETFHVTADIREKKKHNTWAEHSGGCCHDEIAKAFPHLAHLIKWHFMQINEPMYYVENTTYHASNRDHNGKTAGEPIHFKQGVVFGDSPLINNLGDKFAKFLKERQGTGDFQILEVPHINKDGDTFKFAPKYTFIGFEREWYRCPFDTKRRAQNFAEAMRRCKVEFVEFSEDQAEGKDRDFDGARSCAMWPEATEEQLSLPKAELTKLLQDRLPQLVVDFKADMDACGFVYPTLLAAKRGE